MNGLDLIFAFASTFSLLAPRTAENLSFAIVPRQSEPASCGYAVLSGLINLNEADEQAFRLRTNTTEEALLAIYGRLSSTPAHQPLSMLDMMEILADFNISSIPLNMDVNNMIFALQNGQPLILHYDRPLPHFVLGLNADDSLIVVADPESGVVALSRNEFEKRVSGFVLLPVFENEGKIKAVQAKISSFSETAKARRTFLTRLANKGEAKASLVPQKTASAHLEMSIAAGSKMAENGETVFAPELSVFAEWEATRSLCFQAKVKYCRKVLEAEKRSPFDFSVGAAWQHENEDRNKSFGLSFLFTVQPGVDFLAQKKTAPLQEMQSNSRIACTYLPRIDFFMAKTIDPVLLTGAVGIGADLFDYADASGNAAGDASFQRIADRLAVYTKASAILAISSTVAAKAAIEQEMDFFMRTPGPVIWKGWLELGLHIPFSRSYFYLGTRIRLNDETGSVGEVNISFSL